MVRTDVLMPVDKSSLPPEELCMDVHSNLLATLIHIPLDRCRLRSYKCL